MSEFMQGFLVGGAIVGIQAWWFHVNFKMGVEASMRQHIDDMNRQLEARAEALAKDREENKDA